jgi:hypothetical protein
MHGLPRLATIHPFARSALVLSACSAVAALVLVPFSLGRTGSSGPLGLFAAAAICLSSNLVADAGGAVMARISPVGTVLVGIVVRMFLPLGVCVAILASGQSGPDHLAFIAYLLVFYMVNLAFETWLIVRRSSYTLAAPNRSSQ